MNEKEEEDQEISDVRRLRQRIKSLIAAGTAGKAAKELNSTGIHEIHQKLLQLHPEAHLPEPRGPHFPAVEFQCETAEVKAAVLTFPTATAPGPSGLRADHLRECLLSSSGDVSERLLSAFTRLAIRTLNGMLPSSFADFILAARLLPFKKKDEGVRPIAVGEVFRRLVAKVAFRQILPKVQQKFPPVQVGVGIRDAVPRTVLTRPVSASPRVASCKLMSQMHLTLSRQEILDNVWSDFPEVGRWADWGLCNKGFLLTDTSLVFSTNGVQQGDPLGPFFFSVGIQRIISKLNDKYGACIHIWYLDDGVIAGSLEALEFFLSELEVEFHTIKLLLNKRKCKLFSLGNPSPFATLSQIPCESTGLEVLGSPIGTAEYLCASLKSKFVTALEFCKKVEKLDDPQTALALLRLCSGTCRVLHLMKVTSSLHINSFLEQLD